jgi:hypothetical protein
MTRGRKAEEPLQYKHETKPGGTNCIRFCFHFCLIELFSISEYPKALHSRIPFFVLYSLNFQEQISSKPHDHSHYLKAIVLYITDLANLPLGGNTTQRRSFPLIFVVALTAKRFMEKVR